MSIISSWILIFFLSFISLPFHKSESESESKTMNYLPNIERLSKGYNIIVGNPESISSLKDIDQGPRKYPIFDFTFSQKKIDSISKYLVPDQMNLLSTSSECSFSSESSEITNQKSYYDSLKKSVSRSIGFLDFGAFSKSKSYQTVTENLNNEKQVLIKTGSQCIVGTTELLENTNYKFVKDFISTIKELSKGYDQEKYFKFFDDYGTHYIFSATLGSRITSNIFIKSSTYQNKLSSSYSWSKSAKLTYKISVSSEKSTDEEQKISKEFVESYTSEYKTSLGIDPNNEKWNSVSKEGPAILNYELKKISELLKKKYFEEHQISEQSLKKIQDAMEYYVVKYCFFQNKENPNACYGPKIENNMKNKYLIIDSQNLKKDENDYVFLECPKLFLIVGAGYKADSNIDARIVAASNYQWRIIEDEIIEVKSERIRIKEAVRCKIPNKEICYAICIRRPFLDPVHRSIITKEITNDQTNIEISCPDYSYVTSCTFGIDFNQITLRHMYLNQMKFTLKRKNERTCYFSDESKSFFVERSKISLTAVCVHTYTSGSITEGSSDLKSERSNCASNEYVVGCMPKNEGMLYQDYSFVPEEKSCKCTNCVALCAQVQNLVGNYNKKCSEEMENGNGCKECLPEFYGVRFSKDNELYGETMLCFEKLCWNEHPIILPKGKNLREDPCDKCKSCNHKCQNDGCTTCWSFPGGQEQCIRDCSNLSQGKGDCNKFCEKKIKSEYCHACGENYYNNTLYGYCDSCDKSGWFPDGPPNGNSLCKTCSSEIPNCLECYGLGPYCTKCQSGYYFYTTGECTSCQKENEFISDNKCIKCTEVYPNCLKCTAKECQQCSPTSYLTEKKTCKECLELPELQYDNKCKICKEPYYLDTNNVCTKCFVEEVGNCVKCIGRFPNCDFCEINSKKEFICYKCSANYFLNSAKNCVKECDSNEYQNQEYCIKYPYPTINPLEIDIIQNEIRFAKFTNVCTTENNSSTANLNVYWMSTAENDNIVPVELIKGNIPNNLNNIVNLDYNIYKNYGLSEENNIIFPRSLHVNYKILYYCSRGPNYTNIKNIGKLTLNAISTKSPIIYFLIDIQELKSDTQSFNLNKIICLVERLLDLERKNLLIAEKNCFCNDITNYEPEKVNSFGIDPRKETIRFRTYMNPFFTNLSQYENDLKNKLKNPKFNSFMNKELSVHILNVNLVETSQITPKNNLSINLKYSINVSPEISIKFTLNWKFITQGFYY